MVTSSCSNARDLIGQTVSLSAVSFKSIINIVQIKNIQIFCVLRKFAQTDNTEVYASNLSISSLIELKLASSWVWVSAVTRVNQCRVLVYFFNSVID